MTYTLQDAIINFKSLNLKFLNLFLLLRGLLEIRVLCIKSQISNLKSHIYDKIRRHYCCATNYARHH